MSRFNRGPRVQPSRVHCGAGTTAAALRAGIPAVAIPIAGDQSIWARRLQQLGVVESLIHSAPTRDGH
jgi:sterol 3beta-glucosyltransferase